MVKSEKQRRLGVTLGALGAGAVRAAKNLATDARDSFTEVRPQQIDENGNVTVGARRVPHLSSKSIDFVDRHVPPQQMAKLVGF